MGTLPRRAGARTVLIILVLALRGIPATALNGVKAGLQDLRARADNRKRRFSLHLASTAQVEIDGEAATTFGLRKLDDPSQRQHTNLQNAPMSTAELHDLHLSDHKGTIDKSGFVHDSEGYDGLETMATQAVESLLSRFGAVRPQRHQGAPGPTSKFVAPEDYPITTTTSTTTTVKIQDSWWDFMPNILKGLIVFMTIFGCLGCAAVCFLAGLNQWLGSSFLRKENTQRPLTTPHHIS